MEVDKIILRLLKYIEPSHIIVFAGILSKLFSYSSPISKNTSKHIVINNYYIEPQYHNYIQSPSRNQFDRLSYI